MNPLLNFNTNEKIQRPNVPLTQNEVDYIETHVKNLCAVMNFNLQYIKNQLVEVVNPEYPNAIYAQNLEVGVEASIRSLIKLGINRKGDKVLFRGLKINITKTIDRETEEISYNMNVCVDGRMIHFGGREMCSPGLGTAGFQYVPTLESLSFSKVIESLKVLLDFRTLTKSELKKLTDRFSEYIDNK